MLFTWEGISYVDIKAKERLYRVGGRGDLNVFR